MINPISSYQYYYVFYFTDPGCTFFANLTFFHDEVCFFLVWILVFTYWMLYSILVDHTYYINNTKYGTSLFSTIDKFNPIKFNLYIISLFKLIFNFLNTNSYYSESNISTYLKKFLLAILGNQSNNFAKNYNDISFFESNSQSSILDTYEYSSKVIFSGTNSNILSIQGKLLDIEEIFLLTQLSTDYNLVKFDKISNIITNYIDRSSNNSSNNLTYNNQTQPILYSSNAIFNLNFNVQDLFFYKRRLNRIHYSFNPFITIFNDIFSLNDYTNNSYSLKEPGNYNWWEFKYLYTMTRSRQDFLNLSNLSRGINRDIIMASWEYHHSISFEYIWALFPTLVILSIIGPSFILLYSSLSFNDAFLSIKVIGHQWYWSYEISSVDSFDNLTDDNIKFDSRIEDFPSYWKNYISLKAENPSYTDNLYGFNRLLSVNKDLLIIAHKPVNFLITSGDVLHSFAVPAFGIKVDAVPGRINTFYLEGSKLGKYYGQCSELCGFGHGFMPIAIEVLEAPEQLSSETSLKLLNN